MPVDLLDGDRATPLHFAASKGHARVVRWLLRRGARVRADKFGKTPVDDAEESGMEEESILYRIADPLKGSSNTV